MIYSRAFKCYLKPACTFPVLFPMFAFCGNHSKQWSRHAILVPIRELLTPLVIWAHGSFSVMINPNYISLLAKL